MFMGCPYRCRSLAELQGSFIRLFKLNKSAAFGHSPILAKALAGLVTSIDQRFIDTKLQMKVTIINISSSHEDADARVCSRSQTIS